MRTRPTALVVDLTGWDEVVPELLELVTEARAAGRPAVVVPDPDRAPPAVPAEALVDPKTLAEPKPSREYFTAVCATLGTPPAGCLFVDDRDWNIRGARAAGLAAYRWNGPDDLPYLRAALAL